MFTLAILWCVLTSVSAASLPSYFPRCYIDDPDFNNCLTTACETVRPYLRNGVPELSFPSLNPFYLPKIEMQQGTDAVNYNLTLSNVTIYGLADYEMKEFTFNPKNLTFYGISLFKNMSMVTEYQVNGKILTVPLHGKGIYSTVLDPSSGSVQLTGKLVNRNGEDYYEPVNITVRINVSGFKSNFTGLLDGNKELADTVRKVIDENSQEILNEVMPAIETVAEGIVLQLMKAINRVPYKDVFPKLSDLSS